MKLNIKNIYVLFLLLTIGLVSCDSDDYTGESNVSFTAPTATYEIVGGNDVTVDESAIDPEGGMSFTINATIPEAVQFDTWIDLSQTGGTANGSDFSTSRIKIPALLTTGSGTITILQTGDMEGEETLAITANTNSVNIKGSDTFNFTINNDFLNENLIFNLDWCNDYTFDADFGEVKGNLGDVIDLDLLVYDATFADTGNYSAATGACPEHLEMAGMADGLYYVVVDAYANDLSTLALGEVLSVKASYEQEHFVPLTNLIHNIALTSDSLGNLGVIATIEKTGNTYVVTAQ